MVPPLPAPSRPSKMMQIFAPVCCTHSCSLTSSTCSFASSSRYTLFLSLSPSTGLLFGAAFFFAIPVTSFNALHGVRSAPGRVHSASTALVVFNRLLQVQEHARLAQRMAQGCLDDHVPYARAHAHQPQ